MVIPWLLITQNYSSRTTWRNQHWWCATFNSEMSQLWFSMILRWLQVNLKKKLHCFCSPFRARWWREKIQLLGNLPNVLLTPDTPWDPKSALKTGAEQKREVPLKSFRRFYRVSRRKKMGRLDFRTLQRFRVNKLKSRELLVGPGMLECNFSFGANKYDHPPEKL